MCCLCLPMMSANVTVVGTVDGDVQTLSMGGRLQTIRLSTNTCAK